MPRSFSALPRRTSSCQNVLPPSMMTSPLSISFDSASMIASVILPAGSITQAVRGFLSFLTKSSRALAPTAPWAAIAATAFASLSYTTVVCPRFISRRTILPPIRPRPIMPSCILISLIQRILNRSIEHLQTSFEIAFEMHAQRTAAALGQHAEIAACLRGLDHAESGLLTGHGQIPGIVCGNLQEYAAVGAALVGLSGGMQETRGEFRAGRDMALVGALKHHVLQRVDVGAIALDIGEQRHVIVRAGAGEMGL